MESLSPEVIANVAKFLPDVDVAACCAVSHRMRDVFGSDVVWRQRCDLECEEYLRTTPCRVKPKFKSHASKRSTLSPIGRWRTAFLREQHLWKNWRRDKYVEDEIKSVPLGRGREVFLDNDFLILQTNSALQLINASVQPLLCVDKFSHDAEDQYEVSVVSKNKFATWDFKNNVCVFSWTSSAMTLEKSFCVGDERDIMACHFVNTRLVVADRKFLHCWDLVIATKLKSEPIEKGIKVRRLGHDSKCKTLGVQGVIRGSHRFSVYSLEDLKFYPFKKQMRVIHDFAIMDNYVAIGFAHNLGSWARCWINFYNFQSSQRLHKINVRSIDEGSINVVGNSFMFREKNSWVKLILATDTFKFVDPQIVDLVHVDKQLYNLHHDRGERRLWKITETTAVLLAYNIYYRESVKVNQACTKWCEIGLGSTRNLYIKTYW